MTAVPVLPDYLQQYDADPSLVVDEYMAVIQRAITSAPRSQQKQIGPSEIGAPCTRRLGYKWLGIPGREQGVNWKATMGTGAHMWLETAFDLDNMRVAAEDGQERWLVETRVNVGTVDGIEITGSCDLYDRWTGTVIDHKTVGKTQLQKYRAGGAGQQYRAQAHLYGRGWQRAGFEVRTVAVAFLPRDGELDQAHIWHEPYDEQVALDALQRLEGVALACRVAGTAALPGLPTAEQWCQSCPWLRRGSTDPSTGCPGDTSSAVNADTSLQLAGLI